MTDTSFTILLRGGCFDMQFLQRCFQCHLILLFLLLFSVAGLFSGWRLTLRCRLLLGMCFAWTMWILDVSYCRSNPADTLVYACTALPTKVIPFILLFHIHIDIAWPFSFLSFGCWKWWKMVYLSTWLLRWLLGWWWCRLLFLLRWRWWWLWKSLFLGSGKLTRRILLNKSNTILIRSKHFLKE